MSITATSSRKRRIIVAASVGILFVTAALTGYFSLGKKLNLGSYIPEIKQYAERRLNAELDIGGISPSVYPGLGLVVKNLELLYRPDPEAKPEGLFQVKRAKAVLEILPYLRSRRVVFREFILEQPEFVLRRDAQGSFVILRLIKIDDEAEGQKAAAEKKQGLAESMLNELEARLLPEQSQGFEALLNLRRVTVKNARVTIIDQVRDNPALTGVLELNDINFKMSGLSGKNPGKFSIELPFPQQGQERGPPLKLEGQLALDLKNRKARIEKLSGTWGGNVFQNIDVSLNWPEDRVLMAVDVEASVMLDELLQALRKTPLPGLEGLLALDLRGHAALKAHLEYPNAANASGIGYQGRVSLKNIYIDAGAGIAPLEQSEGAIELRDGQVIMPETVLTIGNNTIKAAVTLTDAARPHLKIDAQADELDLGSLLTGAPEKSSSKKSGSASSKDDKGQTSWEGKIRIGLGKLGQMRLKNIRCDWAIQDQVLRLHRLGLEACSGNFEDKGSWVDMNSGEQSAMMIMGRARDMDAACLLMQVLNLSDIIEGKISAVGYIIARQQDSRVRFDTLGGEIKVEIKDGRLLGFNIGVKVLNFLGLGLEERSHSQEFSKISGALSLRDGVAYFDDLRMSSKSFDVAASGSVDFVGQKLDLRLALYPFEAAAQAGRPVPLIRDLINATQETLTGQYFKVTGKWDDPEVGPYLPLAEGPPDLPHSLPLRKSLREKIFGEENNMELDDQ